MRDIAAFNLFAMIGLMYIAIIVMKKILAQ
jgi:hypothetical protein